MWRHDLRGKSLFSEEEVGVRSILYGRAPGKGPKAARREVCASERSTFQTKPRPLMDTD